MLSMVGQHVGRTDACRGRMGLESIGQQHLYLVGQHVVEAQLCWGCRGRMGLYRCSEPVAQYSPIHSPSTLIRSPNTAGLTYQISCMQSLVHMIVHRAYSIQTLFPSIQSPLPMAMKDWGHLLQSRLPGCCMGSFPNGNAIPVPLQNEGQCSIYPLTFLQLPSLPTVMNELHKILVLPN